MTKTSAAAATLLVTAILSACTPPRTSPPPPPQPAPTHPITYTLEPWDFDGLLGANRTRTQSQLGGTQCPCMKIPYNSNGLPANNQQGADNTAAVLAKYAKAGDTVMGFSLGSQVLSLYLSQHTPPPGIQFILLGDTFNRNRQLLDAKAGIPLDIANHVILVVNQYDGWSDRPDKTTSPGYALATRNADAGRTHLHNYVNTRLDDPANVTTTQGNITAMLVPTQKLPLNDGLRIASDTTQADTLDAAQRPQIDDAYTRPSPTPQQLAAATNEQVTIPPAPIHETPEPVATP